MFNNVSFSSFSFFIFDFMPVMDIVVWPDYGEKYLLGLVEMKANALEKLGDSDIYAIIESALLDEDWRVRAVAAKNAEVCSDEIVGALEPALKDKNYFVRINAAQALSKLGEKGAAVLRRLTTSDDNFARDMAHYMLSR